MHVTITIYHIVGDDTEEWVVSDDGGEFDDEFLATQDEAEDDAAGRAFHYAKAGNTWTKETV